MNKNKNSTKQTLYNKIKIKSINRISEMEKTFGKFWSKVYKTKSLKYIKLYKGTP